MHNYLDLLYTPANLALQDEQGALDLYDRSAPGPDALSPEERQHIEAANSFYMATVNEAGWPYVQHRGGPVGFVRLLGPTTIGWLERPGNKQYLGTGNLRADDRTSLIFVDYPSRTRLKLLGNATHHRVVPPELVEPLGAASTTNDGAITVEVAATAWNCPRFITPRFERAHIDAALATLGERVAELEAENARLRGEHG